MLDKVMTRSRSISTRSRSRSASSCSTESVDSPDSYSDYLTLTASFLPHEAAHSFAGEQRGRQPLVSASHSTKAKNEPFDDSHHKLMLRVPTPPPEAVQSKKLSMTATNRRTSTRARSARLATSPLLNNRHVSVISASPAPSHGDSQSKRLTRSRMSASQRAYLHSIYEENPEPTMAERQVIADKLGVQIGKITNWFRNLRQSVRRGKLLDAKLTSTRATTAESKEDDEEDRNEDMDMDEDEDDAVSEVATEDERPVSRSPAPPVLAPVVASKAEIVPGKGAYSTQSLIVASEYAALHSPPEIYAEAEQSDEEEEEEEAHEALTPHPSPESKMAHSFGGPSHLNVSSSTPENMLASPTPSRGGISLPSISISLAQDEKKPIHHQEQKFNSAVEDALLLLHFRQNCDVRDIHHGVVVGRSSSPPLM